METKIRFVNDTVVLDIIKTLFAKLSPIKLVSGILPVLILPGL
jgi:hypothetical protein